MRLPSVHQSWDTGRHFGVVWATVLSCHQEHPHQYTEVYIASGLWGNLTSEDEPIGVGCAHYGQGNEADYWRAIVTAAGGTDISSIEIDADNMEYDDIFYSETKH